jgi:hypothetical protein
MLGAGLAPTTKRERENCNTHFVKKTKGRDYIPLYVCMGFIMKNIFSINK